MLLFISALLTVLQLSHGQACNATFNANTGTVSSPNYPQPYPAGSDCWYTINLNNAGGSQKVIAFTITAFNTYSVGNDRDMLSVNYRSYHGDGGFDSSAMQTAQTYTYRTTDPVFQFRFLTRITNTPTMGFSINYAVTDGDGSNTKIEECDGRTCAAGGTCHSFGTAGFTCLCRAGTFGPDCEFGPNNDGCPHLFNTTTGTIESTNYPLDYPDFHACDMIITNLNAGDSVAVLCEDFRTENNYDFLYIETAAERYHGDGLGDDDAMLIGETYTYEIPAGGSYLRFRFTTDQDTTFRGFSLAYTVTRA